MQADTRSSVLDWYIFWLQSIWKKAQHKVHTQYTNAQENTPHPPSTTRRSRKDEKADIIRKLSQFV